jgi:hypothetical protein
MVKRLSITKINAKTLSILTDKEVASLSGNVEKLFKCKFEGNSNEAVGEVTRDSVLKVKELLKDEVSKRAAPCLDGFDAEGKPILGFDDNGGLVTKQDVPPDSASTEDKRKAQKVRAKKFGIEALDGKGERLTFPAGFPTDLAMYGDPVNLAYPLDPPNRARNARARFKQFVDKTYSKKASKRIIHTRIVKRLLELKAKPSFDKKDSLDALLPKELQTQISKQTTIVQTLIFDKKHFTLAEAKKWVKDHGFKIPNPGIDETDTSYRFRQIQPNRFKKGSFRTIKLATGVSAVIGRLKEEKAKTVKLVQLEKKKDDEQIILAVVLEPGVIDAQKDKLKPSVISEAAHIWLAKFQDRGFMHKEIVNHKIEIYESYIAPANLTINGKKIKKGTWLLMLHILDAAMWKDIKAKKLTGLSIGGTARRVPMKTKRLELEEIGLGRMAA